MWKLYGALSRAGGQSKERVMIVKYIQPQKQNVLSMTDKVKELRDRLEWADTVIIGAGAGLSTASGFIYTGERFRTYFQDFANKYRFEDMYTGGFYPYKTFNEHWAYWSRYIYINRYMNPPKPLYQELYKLVKNKDYFVLTTNVDHCFQKAGFDKNRLYYTQGDYGLFQCSKPCHQETYDNAEIICEMVKAQGWQIGADHSLYLPEGVVAKMYVPDELIPYCPKCGAPMSVNLRADATFVQDEGWDRAAERYAVFLERHRNRKVLFLELGVGYNTPGIIKYPFWQMTAENPKARHVCINYGEAYVPEEIAKRSICIYADIEEILKQL